MSLSKISINRPIMMTMILLLFVVLGIIGYTSMSLDLMPAVDIPIVTVRVIYSGAGPQDVETQISKKLEDEISTVSEIDYMQTYSIDNASIIIVFFNLTKDVEIAKQEIADKVAAIVNDLPADADDPIIDKIDISAQSIMDIVLSGSASGIELFEYADNVLKDRFAQLKGIAKVDIIGGNERQIQIIFNREEMKANNISLAQVSQILAANNFNLPSGSFEYTNQNFTVKFESKFNSIAEIENIEIPTAHGYKKLGQIARIEDTFLKVNQSAMLYDAEKQEVSDNVVQLSLIKSKEGNAVEIAKLAKQLIPEIEKDLPANMNLTVTTDKSEFTESSVKDTLMNILLGVLFTGLILLFFLHDWRSTIIVGLSMPFSIIATVGVAYLSGFTLNIMTLMALSTSVGIIVTNSVIVIENIFRHKNMSENRKDAADKGSAEIFVAVVASTLTNVMVFLPIANMAGMAGRFFIQFALTVTYATIFSLIASFTITPMLASLIIPENPKKSKFGAIVEAWMTRMEKNYGRTLHAIIDKKSISTFILLLTAGLLVFSVSLFPKIGMEFMPTMDEGYLQINIELPQGYNLDSTKQTVNDVLDIVKTRDDVKMTTVKLGTLGSLDTGLNLAQLTLTLSETDERELSSEEVAQVLTRQCASIPNAKVSIQTTSSMGGGRGGAPIEFYLLGQSMDELIPISNEIQKEMKKIEGLINVEASYKPGKKEFIVEPNREQLSNYGITTAEIAVALRYAVEGMGNSELTENNQDYDILVTMDDKDVTSSSDIMSIPLTNGRGAEFTVGQVVTIAERDAYNQLQRRDKFQAIQISAGNAPGYTTGRLQNQIEEIIDGMDTGNVTLKWGGMSQMMGDTNKDMGKAMLLAILLTFMLLAAILESFAQPLLILVTLPLGLIGVALIMFATGTPFNIISLLAIMMLIGIVVNNGILILDYYNQLRKQGLRIRAALVDACTAKLRPIIMSSLSIVIGMLPMAMGIGSSGAEMRRGMGLVTIGGVVSSMLLTLYILPAMISLAAKKKHKTL
ncbi:MAG: efflux RND transporter permease subunit [Candidatus Cloacimonadales bacterium]